MQRREDESVTEFTVRRIRAQFMEEAAKIVEGEFVDAAATGDPTDEAYNRALMDAAEAIRRAAVGE